MICQWLLILIGGNHSRGLLKIRHRYRLKINALTLYKHWGVFRNQITCNLTFSTSHFIWFCLHPTFWSFHFCIIWSKFYKSRPLKIFNPMPHVYNIGVAYPIWWQQQLALCYESFIVKPHRTKFKSLSKFTREISQTYNS